MRKHVARVVVAAVLVGLLGLPCRVEATRVPALRWQSGDHDIYQTCDRNAPSPTPSQEDSGVRGSVSPISALDSERPSNSTILVLCRTVVWLGDLLMR